MYRSAGASRRDVSRTEGATSSTAASLPLTVTGLDDDARSRWPAHRMAFATFALMMAMFIPTAAVELIQSYLREINGHFHSSQIQWVQTSTIVTSAVAVLALGKLGDSYGKRRVLLCQCGAAVIGAVICAGTHNLALLLVGRTVQGLAIGVPVQIYGLARDLFPRRLIPWVITATSAAFALVPLVNVAGSWITAHHSYTALFWALALQGAVTAVLIVVAVPETPLRTRERIDWPGIGLISAAVFELVYGLNEVSVPGRGWTSPWTIGFLTAGLSMGAGWILYLNSSDQSLIRRDVLFGPMFRRILLITLPFGVALVISNAVMLIVAETPAALSPLLHTGYGLGLSQGAAGGYMLIAGVAALPAVAAAGWYARTMGLRLPLAAGIGMVGASVLIMSYGPPGRPAFVLGSAFYFAGDGAIFVAIPLLLMQALPARYQGIGGGTFSVLDGLGGSLASQLVAVTTAHNVLVADPVTGDTIITHDGLHTMALVFLATAAVALLGTAAMPKPGRSLGGALPHAAPNPQGETARGTQRTAGTFTRTP